jgi:Mn-dependent DtxR family transcriptional regulator
MVQKMAKAGLLNYERYRGLTLTPTVEAAALGFRASPPRVYRFPDPVGCAD